VSSALAPSGILSSPAAAEAPPAVVGAWPGLAGDEPLETELAALLM
jgi:hypothetical protein